MRKAQSMSVIVTMASTVAHITARGIRGAATPRYAAVMAQTAANQNVTLEHFIQI